MREIVFYYITKKTASETYHLLIEIDVEHNPSTTTCKDWFYRFRNGNNDIKNKDYGIPTKEFENKELKILLEEDPCQTQTELTVALNVTQQRISQ